MRRALPVLLSATLAVAVAAGPAGARPGALDRHFGRAGAVSLGVADGSALGGAVHVLSDGHVLAGGGAAGRFVVLRLRRGGSLDGSFGRRGQVAPVLPGTSPDGVRGLAVFRDGRIVAAGTLQPDGGGGSRFAVVRLLPRGEIDPSFGDGAGYALAGPAGATLAAMTMDRTGRIVLAGARPGASGEVPLVARLQPDGTPDVSFGAGGVVDGAALGLSGRATSVRVAHDGTVTFSVGTAPELTGPATFTVVRLTDAGAPDATFGGGTGVASVQLSPGSGLGAGAAAVAPGPGGRLLVAGTDITQHGTERAAVLRLRADGTLDRRFGHGGVARVSRRGRRLRVLAMTRVPHGATVLTGTAGAPAGLYVRLSASGRRRVVRFPLLGRPRDGGRPIYTELDAVDAAPGTRVVVVGSIAGPGTLVRSPDGTRFLGVFTLVVGRLLGR